MVSSQARREQIAFATERGHSKLEIIAHLIRGRSSQQIAATLALSVHTVRTHRQNIMEKLGLHNTVELMAWAIRNLPPDILHGA